ncbi:MAG TPA: NUDIX hydrolase, partial [Pseudomonadales bacterium]|nr:NUDIX hydrolase [Pseudomonadales bacterium]
MPEASTPFPSATILMLRDGPTGLETFMVVRHHQIDFASGALVFPGGKV